MMHDLPNQASVSQDARTGQYGTMFQKKKEATTGISASPPKQN